MPEGWGEDDTCSMKVGQHDFFKKQTYYLTIAWDKADIP